MPTSPCFCLFVCFGFICLFIYLFIWFLRDTVSLCSPGCPGIHFVDQAGFELRNPPASASQVLGLKVCTTTPGMLFHYCRVDTDDVFIPSSQPPKNTYVNYKVLQKQIKEKKIAVEEEKRAVGVAWLPQLRGLVSLTAC